MWNVDILIPWDTHRETHLKGPEEVTIGVARGTRGRFKPDGDNESGRLTRPCHGLVPMYSTLILTIQG